MFGFNGKQEAPKEAEPPKAPRTTLRKKLQSTAFFSEYMGGVLSAVLVCTLLLSAWFWLNGQYLVKTTVASAMIVGLFAAGSLYRRARVISEIPNKSGHATAIVAFIVGVGSVIWAAVLYIGIPQVDAVRLTLTISWLVGLWMFSKWLTPDRVDAVEAVLQESTFIAEAEVEQNYDYTDFARPIAVQPPSEFAKRFGHFSTYKDGSQDATVA